MKKSLLIAATLLTTMAVNAQKVAYLNTYSGSDMSKYEGKTMNISTSRYIFNGWNTICMPVSMTEEELNATFGQNCKLETLTNVTGDANGLTLNFTDAKKEGLQANVPYILYYAGETKSIAIKLQDKLIDNAEPKSITINGITFSGTAKQMKGENHYGILAKDNQEANFVAVDNGTSGFYATRCFIDNIYGTNTPLFTTHNEEDATTSIKNAEISKVKKSAIYDIQGRKQNEIKKGINIINGKKVLK